MSETQFSVSPNAAKRIAFLASKEAKPVVMRVAVLGGGCSGFQYNFSFEEQKNDDDLLIERDGAAVVVDSTSLELLKGSEDHPHGYLDGGSVPKDAWGHALVYVQQEQGAKYEMRSCGPDGVDQKGAGDDILAP